MHTLPKKALAGAAVLALALAGCSSNASSTSSSSSPATSTKLQYSIDEQPASNLKDGGTLNLSIGEITPQLNVFQANMTTDTQALWQWYNPVLIKFTPAGEMKIDKNYLDSVDATTKDGNTVVTYKINDKAVWNNGQPIDWTAFETTWKDNNGSDEAYSANTTDGYSQIKSVTQGDNAKTAVVTFNGPFPWYSSLFNQLLNPAVNTADAYNNAYTGGTLASAHPEWGAGPYTLSAFDSNAGTVTFERNPKWWGEKGKLDKVTFTVRDDTQAALNAFKNGEVDVAGAGTANLLNQLQGLAGTEIRKGTSPAIRLITLNSKSPALSDLAVRKAIAESVNREQLLQVIFQGLDYTEKPLGSTTLFPFQKGYQDNFSKVVPKTDTAAAAKDLEGDGWSKGSDGIYEKNGTKLSLKLPLFSTNTTTKAMYQALQTQLKAAGIDVQIVEKSSKDFSTTIKNNDFDLMISGFAQTDPNGVAYFCQVYCSDSTLNHSGTGSAELDKLIKGDGGLQSLPTAEEQTAKANELEVKAMGSFGLIPLYSGPEIYAVKKGLANVGAGAYASTMNLIADFPENIGWQKDVASS
ncbi:peptide/nickel transport system substrate-binding protein [Propionibacterium cyclohexanicum]|uniref:Peptide/nickel transport system substrate-binding protein n=1 Tax=Propionibacterium cyclohexanicum TaxID=64702 RepID=A0A1H9S5E7_9ACTN|nr:ABC transporter family substrate-binding protein [Propionibacterium cyclohexanicum]SER79583.1 peptide/nickel transport system substrate-binding protein [Propionibacterium cyclohexanicum]